MTRRHGHVQHKHMQNKRIPEPMPGSQPSPHSGSHHGAPIAMGRPREFDLENALDEAMDVFWRRGYEGATIAELTGAMGINPPSLYAAFGSKEGLLKAALDRYSQKRDECMAEILEAPTAREVVERGAAQARRLADRSRQSARLPIGRRRARLRSRIRERAVRTCRASRANRGPVARALYSRP